MEHMSTYDSNELRVSMEARDYLMTTSKWASFLAILGFIALGLMVISSLGMFAAGSMMDSAMEEAMRSSGNINAPSGMFSGAVMGGMYLIIAILYAIPVYYLYKFASSTRAALETNHNETLTVALRNLKSHYKFIGIFTIISIILVILSIIFTISMGVAAMAG